MSEFAGLLALPATEADLIRHWTLGDEGFAAVGRRRRTREPARLRPPALPPPPRPAGPCGRARKFRKWRSASSRTQIGAEEGADRRLRHAGPDALRAPRRAARRFRLRRPLAPAAAVDRGTGSSPSRSPRRTPSRSPWHRRGAGAPRPQRPRPRHRRHRVVEHRLPRSRRRGPPSPRRRRRTRPSPTSPRSAGSTSISPATTSGTQAPPSPWTASGRSAAAVPLSPPPDVPLLPLSLNVSPSLRYMA